MTDLNHLRQDSQHRTDVLVVGAGMAGLTAASELRQMGRTVLIVDKSRGVGGRLASRRIGQATFDHGAQFLTARTPRFLASVERWLEAEVAEEWYRDMNGTGHARIRWRGRPTMTAIAKCLARDVDLLLGKRVTLLRRDPAGWRAELDSGESILGSAALLTPPTPQTLALLEAGGIELTRSTRACLTDIKYERCLALLAMLDGASRIPAPGFLAPTESPIAWIADNQKKGVSPVPAVTIHATAAFSSENWDRDREESGRDILKAADQWLESGVTEFQVHGWRYSKPSSTGQSPCVVLSESPPLLLAGDAFGGPRIEGAALSGWAAADTLKAMDLNDAGSLDRIPLN